MICKTCHDTGQRHFGTRDESDYIDCTDCDAAERRTEFERWFTGEFSGLCTLTHWRIHEHGRREAESKAKLQELSDFGQDQEAEESPTPPAIEAPQALSDEQIDAISDTSTVNEMERLQRIFLTKAEERRAFARAILAAVQPAAAHSEVERLRAEQAARVMPLIGPLLDAYEGAPKDELSDGAPGLLRWLREINRAMTSDEYEQPAAAPAVQVQSDQRNAVEQSAFDLIAKRGAFPHITDYVPLDEVYQFANALAALPVQVAAVPEAAQQNGGLVRAALIDLLSAGVEGAALNGAATLQQQMDFSARFARGRHALAAPSSAQAQPVADMSIQCTHCACVSNSVSKIDISQPVADAAPSDERIIEISRQHKLLKIDQAAANEGGNIVLRIIRADVDEAALVAFVRALAAKPAE